MTKRINHPWVRFHTASWIRGARSLSLTQEGVLIRLLAWMYDTQRPLPATLDEVHRIAGAKRRREQDAVDKVLGLFFEAQSDGYHNAKVDKELERYRERISRNRKRDLAANTEHQGNDEAPIDDEIPNEINAGADVNGLKIGTDREGDRERDKDYLKDAKASEHNITLANPFTLYVPYLVEHAALREPQARSMIAKWRKEVGDDALGRHIAMAQRQGVSEPVSYIQAAIKSEARCKSGPVFPLN